MWKYYLTKVSVTYTTIKEGGGRGFNELYSFYQPRFVNGIIFNLNLDLSACNIVASDVLTFICLRFANELIGNVHRMYSV